MYAYAADLINYYDDNHILIFCLGEECEYIFEDNFCCTWDCKKHPGAICAAGMGRFLRHHCGVPADFIFTEHLIIYCRQPLDIGSC